MCACFDICLTGVGCDVTLKSRDLEAACILLDYQA